MCAPSLIVCFWTTVLLVAQQGCTESDGPVYVAPRAEALTEAETRTQTSLPTVTVRGFLNFRTTVDGTVIVFTPASDAPKTDKLQTTNVLGFEIVGGEPANEVLPPTQLSKTSPPEPSKTTPSTSTSRPQYPTGLVTVLGGTHVQEGATTIHETKVIGTYIDGKYAQILQSTSRIIHASSSSSEVVKPTAAFRAPESTPAPKVSPSVRRTPRPTPKRVQSQSSTVLQSSFKEPESTTRALPHRSTQSLRTFKARTTHSTHDISDLDENTIVVTRSRLHRGGTRLRYVPSRNTQTVRLNRFKVRLTARPEQNHEDRLSDSPEHEHEDEDVDPLITAGQQATITSLVTLHAGQRKSVRTLTLTTSVHPTLEPSELLSNGIVEGIMSTPVPEETPPLVVSRVYSTMEHTWRTSLVPVFDGLVTTTHTVTESFIIRKIVTAYTTMPPGDLLVLDDHNDTLADEDSEQYFQTLLQGIPPSNSLRTRSPSSLEASYLALPSNGNLQLSNNPLISLGQAFQNNPLAAVYLGLQQLNQQITLYSTVTHTTVYTTTDTVFSTKVVNFYDGRRTRSRTLSESLSTTERTLTSYSTAVVPYLNTQALQLQQLQQQQLQQLIATQQPPQFSTVTSTYTTVTVATSYSSKIYTLIYNAFSTRYRTVTSTGTYPTTVTITSTSSFQIQPTAQLLPPQIAPAQLLSV
ncbi:mucin-2-like [Ornithodoros turicata]